MAVTDASITPNHLRLAELLPRADTGRRTGGTQCQPVQPFLSFLGVRVPQLLVISYLLFLFALCGRDQGKLCLLDRKHGFLPLQVRRREPRPGRIIVAASTLVKRSILHPGMHNHHFSHQISMMTTSDSCGFCAAKHSVNVDESLK